MVLVSRVGVVLVMELLWVHVFPLLTVVLLGVGKELVIVAGVVDQGLGTESRGAGLQGRIHTGIACGRNRENC